MDLEFVRAQVAEIEKYKWIESERAGRDLGDAACREWILKYAAAFRKHWTETHKK